jgi:hypothetical protein
MTKRCNLRSMTETERRLHLEAQIAWHNIKARLKRPRYKDVKLCKEWEKFDNFKQWYINTKPDGFDTVIDKDLSELNEYSPAGCTFIPKDLNCLFRGKRTNKKLPVGVFQTSSGKYRAKFRDQHIGTYTTIPEAVAAYKAARNKYLLNYTYRLIK